MKMGTFMKQRRTSINSKETIEGVLILILRRQAIRIQTQKECNSNKIIGI